jgi:hypothetical protein
MTGRQPNDKPVYKEGDLEAIVAKDARIKKLIPAGEAIKDSISFNAFQALRAEFPDLPVGEIIKIWKSRIDLHGADYAAALVNHLQALHDDLMAGARFMSMDGAQGVPQRVGLRPTTDDARKINNWFTDRLAAFRKGGWKRDPEGLSIIESIRLWAKANRMEFTKTAAFNVWHDKLRFRKRYRALEKYLSQQFRSVSK